MRTLTIGFLLTLASAGGAMAVETVVASEFAADSNGYVCSSDLVGSGGSHLAVRLSQQQGKWKLSFFISGQPEALENLFSDGDFADASRLEAQLGKVQIGYDLHRSSSKSLMYATKRQDLDDDSTAFVTFEADDKVLGAISSMAEGGIKFGDLVNLSDTSEPLEQFRLCGLDALG